MTAWGGSQFDTTTTVERYGEAGCAWARIVSLVSRASTCVHGEWRAARMCARGEDEDEGEDKEDEYVEGHDGGGGGGEECSMVAGGAQEAAGCVWIIKGRAWAWGTRQRRDGGVEK